MTSRENYTRRRIQEATEKLENSLRKRMDLVFELESESMGMTKEEFIMKCLDRRKMKEELDIEIEILRISINVLIQELGSNKL